MSCAPDTLVLRPAHAGDARSLAAIDSLASLNPLSEARYRQACSSGNVHTGLILVALAGARICGFVLYTLVLDEGSINNIVVDPACQGCGYGKRLLRDTLAKMHSAGACRCLLEVRESNLSALALYRQQGFSVDGRRSGYYAVAPGKREDALLMSKRL